MVAVTHPHVDLLRQAGEETARRIDDLKARVAILAAVRRLYGTSKFVRDQLQAVTDSQDGRVAVSQQIVGKPGRGVVINRRRAAGKNQAFRISRVNLFGGCIERKDLAVNSSFTNATRDQLSVLSAEVKYDYGFVSRLPQKKKTPAMTCTSNVAEVVRNANYSVRLVNRQRPIVSRVLSELLCVTVVNHLPRCHHRGTEAQSTHGCPRARTPSPLRGERRREVESGRTNPQQGEGSIWLKERFQKGTSRQDAKS